MTTIKEAESRIKARVWQEIAQGDIDTGSVDKAALDTLVSAVTRSALMELDDTLGDSLAKEPERKSIMENDDEDLLWTGRPFLSLTLHYTITSERVRITEGLLGKAREDVELIRVQDIDHSQTFTERMLNLGDITIRSHDSSHPLIELKNVKDPQEVHEILRKAVLAARKRHNFTYREEM